MASPSQCATISTLRQRIIPQATSHPATTPPDKSQISEKVDSASSSTSPTLTTDLSLADAYLEAVSRAHSPAAVLWLESLRKPAGLVKDDETSVYWDAGHLRPLTLRNVGIAIKLVRLVGYRYIALIVAGQKWRMRGYWSRAVITAVFPALQLWASSRLMDVVQDGLTRKTADASQVINVAACALLCALGEDFLRYFAGDNSNLVRPSRQSTQRWSVATFLLSFAYPFKTTISPYVSRLMFEAGISAGFQVSPIDDTKMVPSTGIEVARELLDSIISILSKLYLLYRAISAGSSLIDAGWPSIILVGMSAAPALVSASRPFLRPLNDDEWRANAQRDALEKEIKAMGTSALCKQEMTIFGAQDWLLGKWDQERKANQEARLNKTKDRRGFDLGLGAVEESVDVGFYTILALQALPTNLSLGSLKIYQNTVSSVVKSFARVHRMFLVLFHLVFYAAAYVEAVELPDRPEVLRPAAYHNAPLRDYEACRFDQGGVELVATDLSFRYPGTDKDVLHSINLTIRPGTSLAIVGINGAGKSTLIKLLMGLHDHEGSLTLNGHLISSFDPASIHRRTSCLQDYFKYPFSLREYVGLGLVNRMAEDEHILQAMDLGGADALVEKVGLEGRLNPTGDPGKNCVGGVDIVANKKKGEVEKAEQTDGVLARVNEGWQHFAGMMGWTSGPTLTVTTKETIADSASDTEEPLAVAQAPLADAPPISEGHTAALNGGQWQRVALARAFMRASQADLVVFDLDPKAEQELFDRIHALSHQTGKAITTIYISHRFSTVKRADQIAVVGEGTILECGSHAELMAKGGQYAELYSLQKEAFDD